MPELNASTAQQAYLKDTRNWDTTSYEAFTVDPVLTLCDRDEDEQRRLFIMRACRGMSNDGCDNVDPDKVHPAFIQNPEIREQANRYTAMMLADLLAWRERYLDDEPFLASIVTKYDSRKHGALTKDTLMKHNIFWHHPPQFRESRDVLSCFENFERVLASMLTEHVRIFVKRVALGDTCQVNPETVKLSVINSGIARDLAGSSASNTTTTITPLAWVDNVSTSRPHKHIPASSIKFAMELPPPGSSEWEPVTCPSKLAQSTTSAAATALPAIGPRSSTSRTSNKKKGKGKAGVFSAENPFQSGRF